MLDGANNNDDVIGQRAGSQARTPLEAVAEFQVITNQYDAEFGRTTGAIINAISKAGTNAFHGVAGGLWQDASMTGKDFFVSQNGLQKPNTQLQTYRANLGGPVVKDKAHFFFNLERVMIDRANTITIPARPEFNSSPVTAGSCVEHAGALRPSVECQSHVGRALAARVVAAAQSDRAGGAHRAGRRDAAGDGQRVTRGERRRSDAGRHAQLGARWQPPQYPARQLHAGRRVVRQCQLQRQRTGSGGARSAAQLPDVCRSAECRRSGARQRCVPDRRHDVVVRQRARRQPRSEIRRAVRVRRRAVDGAGQREWHLLVQDRSVVQRERRAHVSRAVDDSRARILEPVSEGALHRRVRAGQVARVESHDGQPRAALRR